MVTETENPVPGTGLSVFRLYPILFAHLRAAPMALGTPPIWQDQHEPMSRFRTGVSIRTLMMLL